MRRFVHRIALALAGAAASVLTASAANGGIATKLLEQIRQGAPADVEAMLGSALSGIDGALLQTVEANRRALEHFVSQGVAQEKQFKGAVANIEKMEETFFANRFAMLRDRFGTSWMLIHPKPR